MVSCVRPGAVVVSLEAGDDHHIHMEAAHRIQSLDHTEAPWEDHNHGEISGLWAVHEIAGVDNLHSIHIQHHRILHSHIRIDCHIHNRGRRGLAPGLPRRDPEEGGEGRIVSGEAVFAPELEDMP